MRNCHLRALQRAKYIHINRHYIINGYIRAIPSIPIICINNIILLYAYLDDTLPNIKRIIITCCDINKLSLVISELNNLLHFHSFTESLMDATFNDSFIQNLVSKIKQYSKSRGDFINKIICALKTIQQKILNRSLLSNHYNVLWKLFVSKAHQFDTTGHYEPIIKDLLYLFTTIMKNNHAKDYFLNIHLTFDTNLHHCLYTIILNLYKDDSISSKMEIICYISDILRKFCEYDIMIFCISIYQQLLQIITNILNIIRDQKMIHYDYNCILNITSVFLIATNQATNSSLCTTILQYLKEQQLLNLYITLSITVPIEYLTESLKFVHNIICSKSYHNVDILLDNGYFNKLIWKIRKFELYESKLTQMKMNDDIDNEMKIEILHKETHLKEQELHFLSECYQFLLSPLNHGDLIVNNKQLFGFLGKYMLNDNHPNSIEALKCIKQILIKPIWSSKLILYNDGELIGITFQQIKFILYNINTHFDLNDDHIDSHYIRKMVVIISLLIQILLSNAYSPASMVIIKQLKDNDMIDILTKLYSICIDNSTFTHYDKYFRFIIDLLS